MSIDELALYTQWARLDPRLAEVLVAYLAKHWRRLPFGCLIATLIQQPWPSAILVLLRFAEWAVSQADKKPLRQFILALEKSVPKHTSQELFFIPLQRPISVVMDQEVNLRSAPYTDSGYIGSQPLLPRARPPKGRTLMEKSARLQILNRLLDSRSEITVQDYRAACHNLISPRQAQRDLAETANSRGQTRARRYRR